MDNTKTAMMAIFILIFTSCTSKHDKVDDEYSRGFFNAMAIIQERRFADIQEWPYWDECRKSYLSGQDLYNNWDTTYLINEFHKYKPIQNEHALMDSIITEGYYPPTYKQ